MKEDQQVLSQAQAEELQVILNKHQEVFQEPKGLPPQRSFDHAFNFLLG